jgi:hypothetical protein
MIGWWTANVLPLSRRDRLLVFLGGVLADLDGLGLIFSDEAYFTYHHVVLHNLFAGLAWVAIVGLASANRITCATLAFLNWHLHLACDYFGSRGPMDTPPWVLPYLYPLVGGRQGIGLTGPAWYWNPWQWPLNSWPNILITVCAFAGWVYIAVRLDRTWIEFVWPRFDREICRLLRKWFGGQATENWSESESRRIRRSYLVIATVAFLGCVIAAANA